MTRWIALLSFAVSLHAFSQTPAPPDAQARFLAGLPVDGTPLEGLAKEKTWQEHAHQFDTSWKELNSRQISKIKDWSQKTLPDVCGTTGNVFYTFSGPDMLYVQAFFPHASTYVMCGLEPVGPVPDVQSFPAGSMSQVLGNLRKSLNAVLEFSFFRTIAMKDDLSGKQLRGTIPVIYVFLARAGAKVESAELVTLDDDGKFVTNEAPTDDTKKPEGDAKKSDAPKRVLIHGAKITFTMAGGSPQTAYYFSSDLSNDGIKKHKGFVAFCNSLGQGVGFAKAASYLMHEDYFSSVRDFLLANCTAIVQDDSGIPVKYFPKDRWAVQYFGHYAGPIDMFKKSYQPAISAAMKDKDSKSLPFSFGYRWHSNESSIIVATALKSIPKAEPVKEGAGSQ